MHSVTKLEFTQLPALYMGCIDNGAADRRLLSWFQRGLTARGISPQATIEFMVDGPLMRTTTKFRLTWQHEGREMFATGEARSGLNILRHWHGWWAYLAAARLLRSLG